MSITVPEMVDWCRALLDPPTKQLALSDYLDAIPRLNSLSDVRTGTPVLVRGDVDAKPGKNVGEGDLCPGPHPPDEPRDAGLRGAEHGGVPPQPADLSRQGEIGGLGGGQVVETAVGRQQLCE